MPDPIALASPPNASPPDAAAPPPPRLLSRGFWVMMGFGVLCLLAAAVVALVLPGLGRRHPPIDAPPSATASLPAAAPSAPILEPPAANPPAQVADLQARLQRLEDGQSRVLDAAAEALAASGLSDAAATPEPFADSLAAFQRVLPPTANTAGLRALALQGAPTRAALAAELSQVAARLSVEARAPRNGAAFLDQIAYALSRVVSIRRLDPSGAGADAVIARAQRLADQGDLPGAVATLDGGLPTTTRAALQSWREQALRRIAIDAAIDGLRAQAVADLALARAVRP